MTTMMTKTLQQHLRRQQQQQQQQRSETMFLMRRSMIVSTLTQRRQLATLSKSYEWNDPMQLEAQLSDSERAVRDQTAAYAQQKLLPRVTKAYRNESFDREIIREMGGLGLLGATIEGWAKAKRNICKKNLFDTD
jgi:alkylation response protein AidB-like acyl-CoA dehydrogenase